jgi:hypothetical protein
MLLQGLIHVSELLAPTHLVEGEEAEDEAEAYSEVDNIDPAAYYKVCTAAAAQHAWVLVPSQLLAAAFQ